MRITKVVLENFRNYKKAEVELNSDLVLILGENATGKTNFLESIYYLSTLKSFRGPDNILVLGQQDYFRISAQTADKKFEIAVTTLPTLKRSYKIDGQKVTRPRWMSFAQVLFVPSDLNMFALGPSLRRKFLDETLVQTRKDYASDLVSLDHVLKQRTSLFDSIFRQKSSVDELDVWDGQLAELAVRISSARHEFLEFVRQRFGEVYHKLTGFENEFRIDYKQAAIDKADFLSRLAKLREAEIRSSTNLLGPHREDFLIIKDGQINVNNSSRGELRSQILALKLIQAEYLDSKNLPPIILLDDVFSELDETRRAKLIESLDKYQIIITSTEEHHLPKLNKDTQVLQVKDIFRPA